MNIRWQKHRLEFTFNAGTSRGVLTHKDTWYLIGEHKDMTFYGECGPLKGLSPDDRPDFEAKLDEVCTHLNSRSVPAWDTEAFIESLVPELQLSAFPSIVMGLETLHNDYLNKGQRNIFNSSFYTYGTPITINGLIWMNDPEHMFQQVKQKVEAGFNCIKLKVGAIDFEQECRLLERIREGYPEDQIMLRLDANGAFKEQDVWQKLERLAAFDIHSIEQPIVVGQTELMRQLCKDAAMEIALDEELIGYSSREQKEALLEDLNPPFIILKPTLLGGFASTSEWIELAEYRGIEWWITSALESNIGLNAICQYTASYPVYLPQGLGTGSLYHNNIPSPLHVEAGLIQYDKNKEWDLSLIKNKNL